MSIEIQQEIYREISSHWCDINKDKARRHSDKEGGLIPLDILSDDGNNLLWYLRQISFPQIEGQFGFHCFARILASG